MSSHLQTDGKTATDGGFIIMMGHFEAKFYDEIPEIELEISRAVDAIRRGLVALGYSEGLVNEYIPEVD